MTTTNKNPAQRIKALVGTDPDRARTLDLSTLDVEDLSAFTGWPSTPADVRTKVWEELERRGLAGRDADGVLFRTDVL